MADDDFQTKPDDTNPEEDMKQDAKLPEDHDTPFSPPDDVQDKVDDTHQATDDASNVDSQELYDAGREASAGVEPPATTEVNDYDPLAPGTEAGGTQDEMPTDEETP